MANPASVRMVLTQLQDLQSNPLDGVTLRSIESIAEVEAEIRGPEDTPFAGGTFVLVLRFTEGYPDQPPLGLFRTRIFHPNVSDRGEICVNALKKDWTPTTTIRHLLTIIRCLLIEPNPESALNEEAGRLLLEDYNEYFKKAKMITNVHAIQSVLRNIESTNTPLAVAPTGGVLATDKKAHEKKKAMLKRL